MGLQERFDVSVNFNITSSGQGATAFKDMHNTLGRLPRVAAQAAAGIEKIRDAELGLAKAAMSSTRARELWNKAAIRGGQLQERFGDRAYGMQMGQQVQAMAQYRRELQAQIRPMQQAAMQQFRGMGDPTGMAYALGANQYTRQGAIGRQFAGGSSLRELRALSTEMGRVTKSGVGLSRTWQAMHRTGAVGFRAVATGAKETADATDKMNRSLGRTAVALMALFKIQQAFRDMTNLAREFHTQLVQISAIMQNTRFYQQGSTTNILGMKADIRGMAAQYGVGRGDIAAAVNEIFQAVDVPTNTGIQIATTALRAAKGTRTELESMTKLLLSAYNAMDLKANDLEAVSDRLITMWKDGVITFDEAQNALGKIFQAASLFGATAIKDLDKVFAAMTAVTKQGGAVQRNMTYLTNVLLELTEPKTREKLTGVGIDFTQGETPFDRNWSALMQILQQGPEFINQQFTDKRVRMGLSVLENQLSTLTLMIDKMAESAGTTRKNLERMMDDPSARLDKLKEKLLNVIELMGADFIMSVDEVIKPFSSMNTELDKLIGTTPELNAWAGVWRGIAETFLTLASVGIGGAAIGSLLGMGSEMAAASALPLAGKTKFARFLASPFQSLGRNVLGGAAGIGIPGAAAGLAIPAAMTGVGLGVTAVAGATIISSAVRQENMRQQARLAENARRQVEDLQQSLYEASTAANTFDETFERALTAEGGQAEYLRQELHNMVADFITAHQELAEDLGMDVTEEGAIIMDTTGKVATSIQDLKTIIESLSAANYEQLLNDIKSANADFLLWSENFRRGIAKEKGKEYEKTRGQLLYGYVATEENRPEFYFRSRGRYERGKGGPSAAVQRDYLADMIRTYYGIPADERDTWLEETYGVSGTGPVAASPSHLKAMAEGFKDYFERYRESTFGGQTFEQVMGGTAASMAAEEYTKQLEEWRDDLKETTEASKEGKTKQEKAAELLGEQNEAQEKINTRIEGIVDAYSQARREIEQTLQLEVETGQLKAEDVEERRRELEQQKLLPLILKTRVMLEDDTVDLSEENVAVLNAVLLEYGYVLDSSRLLNDAKRQELETQERINQYAEEYAQALQELSRAMAMSADKLLQSVDDMMKPIEDAVDLRGQKDDIFGAIDPMLQLAMAFAPPELRPYIESLTQQFTGYLGLRSDKVLLDTLTGQPSIAAKRGEVISFIQNMLRTGQTGMTALTEQFGVPAGTVGPFATPQLSLTDTSIWPVGAYDPKARMGGFGAAHHGLDIFGNEGDVVRAVKAGKIVRIGKNKLGDYRVWVEDDKGWRHYYTHLKKKYAAGIKLGAGVKAGQPLGYLEAFQTREDGSKVYDPHVHYSTMPPGMGGWDIHKSVDPMQSMFSDVSKLMGTIGDEVDPTAIANLAQNTGWQAFLDEIDRVAAEETPKAASELIRKMMASMMEYGEFEGQFKLGDAAALAELQPELDVYGQIVDKVLTGIEDGITQQEAQIDAMTTQYLNGIISMMLGIVTTGQAQGGVTFTGEGSRALADWMSRFVGVYEGTPEYDEFVAKPLESALEMFAALEENPEALSTVQSLQIEFLRNFIGGIVDATGGAYQGEILDPELIGGLLTKFAPILQAISDAQTKEDLDKLVGGNAEYADFWTSLLDDQGAAIRATWGEVAPAMELVILALQQFASMIAGLDADLRAKMEQYLDDAIAGMEDGVEAGADTEGSGGGSPTGDAAGAVTDLVGRTTSGVDPARSKVMRTRGRFRPTPIQRRGLKTASGKS